MSTSIPPIPGTRPPHAPRGAGVADYLKEAFVFRWNLLMFFGSLGGAALAPLSDVTFPLVMAGELVYLTALIAMPRFRAAIDARVHATQQEEPAASAASP